MLRERYLTTPAAVLARELGRSVVSVYARARCMALCKLPRRQQQ
jgi:hypothetical protein